MSRQLTLNDLDFSFVPKDVLADKLWVRCLELALNSRSENQRYGAVVVRDGKILGEGWNRLLAKGEPFPFPTTFFLHAERAAIGNAMLQTGLTDLNGSTVYVAGFLMPDKRPLVRRLAMLDKCSCDQCAKLLSRFGLAVAIMSEQGWKHHSAAESLLNSVKNARLLKASGVSRRDFRRQICL